MNCRFNNINIIDYYHHDGAAAIEVYDAWGILSVKSDVFIFVFIIISTIIFYTRTEYSLYQQREKNGQARQPAIDAIPSTVLQEIV